MDKIDKVVSNTAELIDLTGQMAENDVNFYKTVDKKFSEKIDASSGKLVGIINRLIKSIDNTEVSELLDSASVKESLETKWKNVGNIFDGLYEKADIALDLMAKQGSNPDTLHNAVSAEVINIDDKTSIKESPMPKVTTKPQLGFKVAVDNADSHPFKPKLTSKPHSLKSLEDSLVLQKPEEEGQFEYYSHPYEVEIDRQEYPESILEIAEPISSRPWPGEEPIWVDSKEKVAEMLVQLKKAQEIAVDLEHHDYRSYYGIVCLMQISTRDQDWLIDTLALRDDLQCLNEVFTDPQIVKVFHGAFMDIIWLQRDLGLYIVSLFDTYHASKSLGFPKHGLAYLLERFANFKTNKKYQMADWRIRPLTNAMKLYAKADTHFLLNIYDQLRNMLIEKGSLSFVLKESREVCKRKFEYNKYKKQNLEQWQQLMSQYNIDITKKQLLVDLIEWRDFVARRDDESPVYVMNNQLLVSLVNNCPTDSAGVLGASNSLTKHVRVNSKEIAELIENSLKKSELEDMEYLKSEEYNHRMSLSEVQVSRESINTERDVFLNISGFNSIVSSLGELYSGEQNTVLKKASNYLSQDSEIHSFRFGIDGVEFKSKKELHNRLVQLFQILKSDVQKVKKTTVMLPKSEVIVPKDTKDSKKRKKSDDKNEIIVIKKKKAKVEKEPVVGTKADTNEPSFDYKATNSMLEVTKTKNPKQKRQFNPYKQEYEEPEKPAKKKSRVFKKSISYRK